MEEKVHREEYTLAKDPKEITISEILRVLEGESLLVDISNDGVDELESFINENLWKGINDKINEYFKSITLQDLVDKYQLSKEGIIYYI